MSKTVESVTKILRLNYCSSLRGNKYKIFKSRCKLNLKKNFFNNRIVNVWNKLPTFAVCSSNNNDFKNSLVKIMLLRINNLWLYTLELILLDSICFF